MMKKTFLTMMVLALSLQTWAQDGNKKSGFFERVTLIPKVGLNVSNTSLNKWPGKEFGVEEPETKALIGPVVGIEAEYSVNEWLGASAALLYSMQGRKYDDVEAQFAAVKAGKMASVVYPNVSKEHHHYINLPLTANFYLLKGVKGLALRTGIQLGMMFYETGVENEYRKEDKQWHERTLSSSLQKFDVSIPIGVSYAMSNGIQFDLRYNFGLNNISRSAGTIEEKNRVVQFTVGYRLNILH